MLRVFFMNVGSTNETMSYKDYTCSSWSVAGTLLTIHTETGIRYVPMCNVESFLEVEV